MGGLKSIAAGLWRRGLCMKGALLAGPPRAPIAYVVEEANWVIAADGTRWVGGVEALRPGTIDLTTRPDRHPGAIMHFGSQFLWGLWARALPRGTRTVVNYYHGKREDGPEMARHIDFFLERLDGIEKVVTAATLIERRLKDWGVPAEKLAHVPLAVDTTLFHVPTPEEKAAARRRLGVPDGTLCLGSFQKDGVGWGDGMEPKLIKGPDLFVEAAARLAKDFPLFVLLTGPARGWVKAGLDMHGIPWAHHVLDHADDVAACYGALDLYIVTARDEGGPKALLESQASGVPLVSTRVGMAEDLVRDGETGHLVEVGDLEAIVASAGAILSDPGHAETLRIAGRKVAEAHDWAPVTRMLLERVYGPMLG